MIKTIASQATDFADLFTTRCGRNAIDLAGEPLVTQILEDVRRRGDQALLYWTQKLDGVLQRPEQFTIEPKATAIDKLEPDVRQALEVAAQRIRAYHERFLPQGWFDNTEPGVHLGMKYSALKNVGIYVPGGKAAYPSSVLMCAIPAQVAGVENIYMVTPPKGRYLPLIIEAAAAMAGVKKIFHIGGAQAIAALAFGTQTVPKVDKIVGPGNRYVAEAKRQVFGLVDIDSVAGPSEVCIIADGSVPAAFIAADAIAQAEHDEAAAVLLLVLDEGYAQEIQAQITTLLAANPRAEIAQASLTRHGLIVLCQNMDEMISLANQFAPEHLELMVQNPAALLPQIHTAGAVFLGAYTPEAVGDYIAGPNHVLPTQGTARFFSPLGTTDFIKRTSLTQFDATALARYGQHVITLAEQEALVGHGQSIRIRL